MEFAPDLCSRVTFVNFTVTRSSLQSQCLNQVLKAERPDVDQKRSDLLKLQGNSIFFFFLFNFFLLVRFNLEQYILWLKKEKKRVVTLTLFLSHSQASFIFVCGISKSLCCKL